MRLCCGEIMNNIGSTSGQYYACIICGNIQYPIEINSDKDVSI